MSSWEKLRWPWNGISKHWLCHQLMPESSSKWPNFMREMGTGDKHISITMMWDFKSSNVLRNGQKEIIKCFFQSYKCNPANIDVVEWIASYMLSDVNVPERAIIFYKHANQLKPNDPKWLLSVAACYRKMGNNAIAKEFYQKVYKQFPDNVQALQLLARLSKELGSNDAKHYAEELKKLEKSMLKQSARSSSELRSSK